MPLFDPVTAARPHGTAAATGRSTGLALDFVPLPPDAGAGFHVQPPGPREAAA